MTLKTPHHLCAGGGHLHGPDRRQRFAEDIQVQCYNWTNAGITGKVDLRQNASCLVTGEENLMGYAGRNGITISGEWTTDLFSGSGYYVSRTPPSASPVLTPEIYPASIWRTAAKRCGAPLAALSAFSESENSPPSFTQEKPLHRSLGHDLRPLRRLRQEGICPGWRRRSLTQSYNRSPFEHRHAGGHKRLCALYARN